MRRSGKPCLFEGSVFMTTIRTLLAIIIWLLDLALKLAVAQLFVRVVWLCAAYPFGFAFGTGWIIASALVGLAIVGFFEGCDIILNGIGKRLTESPQKRTNNPMNSSGG